jgi:hypothetical protein
VARGRVPEEAATADGREEKQAGGEFAVEVNLLGRLRHRNVVRMLGYVSNNLDTMVLSEYMVNGSLWEALHGKGGRGKMLVDWVSRRASRPASHTCTTTAACRSSTATSS